MSSDQQRLAELEGIGIRNIGGTPKTMKDAQRRAQMFVDTDVEVDVTGGGVKVRRSANVVARAKNSLYAGFNLIPLFLIIGFVLLFALI